MKGKNNKSTRTAHTDARDSATASARANPVWIRTRDPDDFQNLVETSLSRDTSMIKF